MSFGLVLFLQMTLKNRMHTVSQDVFTKGKRWMCEAVVSLVIRLVVGAGKRGGAPATRSSAQMEAATLQADDRVSEWNWRGQLAQVQIL